MKHIFIFIFLGLIFFQCTVSSDKKNDNASNIMSEQNVNYGTLKTVKNSEIMSNLKFVKLESKEDALIGKISHVKVYNDKIYILDTHSTMSLLVFSKDGKFLNKIKNKGNGPGEFMNPHSFCIDERGYLFILDMQLNRLLKYDLTTLTFIEEITIPYRRPISFQTIPEKDLYVYYYNPDPIQTEIEKQIIIADKNGNPKAKYLDITPSSKVTYGDRNNIYWAEGQLNIYPNFTNEIYTISNDSIKKRYNLSFGKNKIVDKDIFLKDDTNGGVMREIMESDQNWVSFLYVYETKRELFVRYFIKTDLYLGVWNKETSKALNFEYTKVVDDLNIGGKFPYPVGVYQDQFIGVINPFQIVKNKTSNNEFAKIIKDMTEEDNPILVFYSVEI